MDWSGLGLSLVGGMLIGVSVSWMLVTQGRVVGISGIFGSLLEKSSRKDFWRWAFLFGLIIGGLITQYFWPSLIGSMNFDNDLPQIIVAGFLVGFGTTMGNGCTSGHGVCGISRLSPRSILATVSFIVAGVLVVYILN